MSSYIYKKANSKFARKLGGWQKKFMVKKKFHYIVYFKFKKTIK